jgi:cytochrome oxidase Cu insertion factor (SCO1/SenC/PrrC family)
MGAMGERWNAVAFALVASLPSFALGACGQAPVEGAGSSGPRTDVAADDPAAFGALPDFQLVDQNGHAVSRASLLGHPLVFGALYTTCTGPCPSIARGLEHLQGELAGTDVRIVVVSVDPEVDSPEVLRRYAERMGADPERWLFLTGPEAEAHALVREGFFLAVARAEDAGATSGNQVTHDVRLLAVDRSGVRRGWYTGTDEVQLERLHRRLLYLASEPVPEAAPR